MAHTSDAHPTPLAPTRGVKYAPTVAWPPAWIPGFGWCVLTPLVSGQVREHQALQDVALPGI